MYLGSLYTFIPIKYRYTLSSTVKYVAIKNIMSYLLDESYNYKYIILFTSNISIIYILIIIINILLEHVVLF